MTGAYFGKSVLEIGTQLENQAFESWKAWASGELSKADLARGSAYTSTDDDEEAVDDAEEGEDSQSSLPPSQLPQSSLPASVST